MASLFVQNLGESPFIKIIDFLLDNYIFDFTKSDIARETGISRVTLDKFFNILIKQGIIFKTKKIGMAEIYRLNTNSEIVKAINNLEMVMIKNKYLKQKQSISMPVLTH